MKKIHTLSSLLEQTKADDKSTGTKIELTGNVVTMSKADKVRIKWPYRYSWPASNPILGDMEEFAKILNTEKGGKDGKSILDQIKQTDATHFVGIATDAASTQKDRLLRKDLGQIKGFVYLFHPNTINQELVPDSKKLPQVANRFTFVVDAEWKKYLATDKPVTAGSTTGKPAESTAQIKVNSILDEDGKYFSWFNADTADGLRVKFINPVGNTLDKSPAVTLLQSGAAAEIFWQFMSKVPTIELGKIDLPANDADVTQYSELLQASIKKLLVAASKFDAEAFSPKVGINTLNFGLWEKISQGLVIIGLNNGSLTEQSTAATATAYYDPFIRAKAISDKIDGIKNQAADDASKPKSTDGFDGTAVNTEMDLAKIISGVMSKSTPPKTLDTLDKVKTEYDSVFGANAWADTLKTLPWKKGPAPASSHFNDVQYSAIGRNGTYGDKTVAGFKNMFDASTLK
jgi:hypothetical protein